MKTTFASLAFLLVGSIATATADADYLAPDPGTHISIQLNAGDVIIVRPVGGAWSHPLCPDVTAAVLTSQHFARHLPGTTMNFNSVRSLLTEAAMNGRSVNLLVSDTFCHANGYPLIESLRIFP